MTRLANIPGIGSSLGLTFSTDLPLIEGAHRLGGMPPPDTNRPHPANAKFFHCASKEKILQVYHQQLSVTVRGKRILIFQDFSTSVTAK